MSNPLITNYARRIEDWYATGEEFEKALENVRERAETLDDTKLNDLCDTLEKGYETYGMRASMSASQWLWFSKFED